MFFAFAAACGGSGSALGGVDMVDGEEVVLGCPGGGEPVRLRLPPEAVVQTYLCDDEDRCATVGHVLVGDMVEVPCTSSTARQRKIRWAAPVR